MTSDAAYLGLYFNIRPLQPAVDILIAQLGQAGFESFVETETGLYAYIQKSDWHDQILDGVMILNSTEFEIDFTKEEIKQVNWNAEWETSFEPIVVENLCTVRAPFHERSATKYEVVIEPKMSFGTGHHETTYMMIQQMLSMEFRDKSVLDMGCGTGVLAILADMKSAAHIDAIDIDSWCYLNSLENVERNSCKNVLVYQGDVDLLEGKDYDIVLANINKNIIIQHLESYVKCLNTGGILLLSGFYMADIPSVKALCDRFMLKLIEKIERNNWVSLKFLN